MPLKASLRPAQDIDHVHDGVLPTPFHSRTSRLNINQQWNEWNGFQVSRYYADAHLEYFSTRNACGVYDVSPMRKYRFEGTDAEAMLDRMVTRDVTAQAVNTVAYNVWCTDSGRLVDDGTLFRLGQDEFMLCCADPCYDWFMLSAVGFDAVNIRDISEEVAALALQGPTSCALLKAMGFSGIEQCKPFQIARFPYGEGEIMISRTGYTATWAMNCGSHRHRQSGSGTTCSAPARCLASSPWETIPWRWRGWRPVLSPRTWISTEHCTRWTAATTTPPSSWGLAGSSISRKRILVGGPHFWRRRKPAITDAC